MKLREIHIRWIGIPIVAWLATAVYDNHMPESTYLYRYFMSFCFTALYWNGAYLIIKYFRRKFPELTGTQKRLIFTDLSLLVWLSFGGTPLKLFFEIEKWTNVFDWQEQSEFMPFNFVAGLVITLSYEAFYFFEKWKETFRQNEELKNRQIRTQYEVLQNQMSPHFLFNSLNTLASIIPEDSEAAVSFTVNLSDVYRYILQKKERELVTLSEEVDFVKSYLFLLRMRFPDNLTFEFDIEKEFEKLSIPPLTLQMLIENAIKHNVISKSKPLHIDIYIDNGKSIVVKNNLQKKESLEKSTKTGLENIKKRYSFLGGKKIDVISSTSNFMVAVPLIDVLEESDLNLT
ncbi:MAG: histidine kinase [Cyclobacteriaceae bacterium]